jgi:4-hydroxy-3-methylbut-2-enyl diphosphate reductase
MKVIRARVLGFCMGVRRAVEMAETELARVQPSAKAQMRVYSLGPLIHNGQVLSSLEAKGLSVLDAESAPPPLKDAAVIIRAHGVGPITETALREFGARVVDATCPRVKKSQNTAQCLAKQGCRIFIAGEKDHAEVRGISGYVEAAGGERAIIAGNAKEAEAAARALRQEQPDAAAALVAQTTFSPEEYALITAAIKMYFPDLTVKNTICGATRERQDALRELCTRVDAVVTAGGKDSANTRRLAAIARDCGKRAFLVEDAPELAPGSPAALELCGCGASAAIGLCAGASTPDAAIDGIEAALEKLGTVP